MTSSSDSRADILAQSFLNSRPECEF